MVGVMVVAIEMGTGTEMGTMGMEMMGMEMGVGPRADVVLVTDGSNLKKPLPDRSLEQNAMPVGMI